LLKQDQGGQGVSLGLKREVVEVLRRFNTAPDGSGGADGMSYGPGVTVELPLVDDRDEVFQALVRVIEEDIAWPVLSRLCKSEGWALMDPDSGRTFTG
jgi:hypothetical protein